jgi:hypothetical protein
MSDGHPPLYVLFTMDCHPAGMRTAPDGPRTWEQSIRSIDGYCTRLLNAGYAVTLFLSPHCAAVHEPFVEELAGRGVELGLFVQPASLEGGSWRGYLGQFDRETQHAIIMLAMEGFQDVVGSRPLSVRSSMFSANDATFGVLTEHGFRRGSLSSPGRRIAKQGADWTGAERDPHYADGASRLRNGDLPFLEIPVTTDANRVRGGVAADLGLENGTVESWHRPLIEAQLARMESQQVPFKALCFFTRNWFSFNTPGDALATTLDQLIAYLDALRERYDIHPVTTAGAQASFRSNE